MRIKLIRRLFLIRLAISFVLDYWKIGRLEKQLVGEQRVEAINQVYAKAGKRMRHTAFRLKGIIVKVGQFLSMREDVLPKAFTEQLVELQDAMPAAPFEEIQPVLEKELRGKLHTVFLDVEEKAAAAASLAQVHRAILMDGTSVAVKILRPGIEKLAQVDLDTLGIIAKVTQRIPSIRRTLNFVEMHREFTETIHRELNAYQELEHLQRFETMFSDNARITVPRAYEEYTTRRLLVMEYVEGARVTDQQKLMEWGIDRLSLAETLLESYLRQILVYGFVHVDPHPGNLLVFPDQRLCFLDFGMIDELSRFEVETIRKLLQSLLLRDAVGMVEALDQLGFLPKDTDKEELRAKIEQFLSPIGNQDPLSTVQSAAAGLQSVLRNHHIQLQAKYMFILRGIGFLKSTLSLLAPQANWFEVLSKIGPAVIGSPVKAGQESSTVNNSNI